MFDLILSPINAIRSWVAHKTLEAARAGAADGLTRFAAELHQQFAAELPAPAETPPAALPMPSAAQITAEDDRTTRFREVQALLARDDSLSQRKACETVGVPESSYRDWAKKEAS